MVRQRVRIRFSKSGNLKYIGHKDLLRFFESLFRRARLPMALSGGYHPKIRMSFPSALALGIEGFDEVLELEMDESVETVDSSALLADLNRRSVDGLTFLAAKTLDEGEKKAKLVSSIFEISLPEDFRPGIDRKIRALLAETSLIVEKANGKSVDLRPVLIALDFSQASGLMKVELATQSGPEAGIRELLKVLGLESELFQTVFPKRIRCRLADEAAARGVSEEGNTEKNTISEVVV